jgi:hypothetical protein
MPTRDIATKVKTCPVIALTALAPLAWADVDVFVPCEGPITIGPRIGMIGGRSIIQAEGQGLCVLASKNGEKPTETEAAEGPCFFKPVYTVADIGLEAETDGTITIKAQGVARSAGWRHATLVEKTRSADGVEIRFELVACPAPDFSAAVLSRIEATVTTYIDRRKLRKVVVTASNNRRALSIPTYPRDTDHSVPP